MSVPAKPSVTYGHAPGGCFDMEMGTDAGWVKTQNGQTLSAIAVTSDDIFDLQSTGSSGSALGYWSYPDESGGLNLSIDPATYKKARYRFKCDIAVPTMRARIEFVYEDGYVQTVLANSYSALMKGGVVSTINMHGTLDHIRLYCNADIGHVYYDLVLIYKNDFVVPNTAYGQTFSPPARFSEDVFPGHVGGSFSFNGSEAASWVAECDLDTGDWKTSSGRSDTIKAWVFSDISHNSYREPFQILFDSEHTFKVVLTSIEYPKEANSKDTNHKLKLEFKENRRSSADGETVEERFGMV